MTITERIEHIQANQDLYLFEKANLIRDLVENGDKPANSGHGDEVTRAEWDAMTAADREAFINGIHVVTAEEMAIENRRAKCSHKAAQRA